MASRVARWAFAAVYGIVALIAVWGGVVQLNPPTPPPNPPFDPNPAVFVNSAMFTAGMFYFLTALAFGACCFFAMRDIRADKPNAVAIGLNRAFAAFLAIVGAYFAWYGADAMMRGDTFVFVLTGLAMLASAFFVYSRKPLGAMIYAGVIAVWVVFSFIEAGLDFTALIPRLPEWIIVGLWFLSPWYRSAMGKTTETPINAGGLWVGIAAGAAALMFVVSAFQTYPVQEGTKNAVAAGPAVTDWRNYGGVPGGQRFAQIDQINLDTVGKLEKAWEFRTGVGYDFKQTPQMANGMVYLCTAGNTLIAVDSDTGAEIWSHETQTNVPGGLNKASTFARTCRGLGYYEAPATYTGECAKRIVAGTVDARLLAVDAFSSDSIPVHLITREALEAFVAGGGPKS